MDDKNADYKLTVWDMWDYAGEIVGGLVGLALVVFAIAAVVAMIAYAPIGLWLLAGAGLIAVTVWATRKKAPQRP